MREIGLRSSLSLTMIPPDWPPPRRVCWTRVGKTARDYIFTPFATDRESDGYLIFDCSGCEDGSASIMSDQVDPDEAIYAIMTSCFYVGYVRRDH